MPRRREQEAERIAKNGNFRRVNGAMGVKRGFVEGAVKRIKGRVFEGEVKAGGVRKRFFLSDSASKKAATGSFSGSKIQREWMETGQIKRICHVECGQIHYMNFGFELLNRRIEVFLGQKETGVFLTIF